MVVAALVMMAAESGELSTTADIDIMLSELTRGNHRDQTWREIVDALLDCRTLAAREAVPA